MPEDAFPLSYKVKNIDKKDAIIAEELEWAKEADRIRQRNALIRKIVIIVILVIAFVLFIFFIKKLLKYRKALKEAVEIKPEFELDYFRDIPNENSTPAEALYLYNLKNNGMMFDVSKVFSATLLNLCLKKYVSFEVEENSKNKKDIRINLNSSSNKELLKDDEKIVYELLEKVQNKYSENGFTMKQFEKYAQSNATSFSSKIQKIKDKAYDEQVRKGNISIETRKKYEDWSGKGAIYLIVGLITFTALPVAILAFVNSFLCFKIAKKYIGFTQKGANEEEQWKGLKKFMEDFSQMEEKEVPELILWEKYLVYATAFGIADKVIEQLKVRYPEITDENYLRNSSYMYLVCSNNNFNFINNISSSVSRAYTSSTASSSTGSGGGFSGGGGRRPEEDGGGGGR